MPAESHHVRDHNLKNSNTTWSFFVFVYALPYFRDISDSMACVNVLPCNDDPFHSIKSGATNCTVII